VRKSYTVTVYPDELKSKVHLLKHFERYMMDRLYGDHKWCYKAMEKQQGMEFVQKYLRMKHVILFKMSHDCLQVRNLLGPLNRTPTVLYLQFNFNDHTKVILSCSGLRVTHIDKSYNLTRWKLSQVMADSLSSDPSSPEMDADKTKFRQRLFDKLKYCKEVLGGIKSATAEAFEEPAITTKDNDD
jgi:cell cycle serine/threonine-protein kinase CDC5/MSD2